MLQIATNLRVNATPTKIITRQTATPANEIPMSVITEKNQEHLHLIRRLLREKVSVKRRTYIALNFEQMHG